MANSTWGQWNTWQHRLSQEYILGHCDNQVLSSRLISKPFRIANPSLCSQKVQTFYLLGYTTDKNTDVKMLRLQRFEAQKFWTNKQQKTTHLEILGKYSLSWLKFLFHLWSCFLGSSTSPLKCPLASYSNAWMSLFLKESKAFYIRSVPGDGFPIFVSLCELLPKMSNPLQACL